MRLRLLAMATLLLLPAAASAGPWTRDPGSFYIQAGYSYLAARKLYLPTFTPPPGFDNTINVFCPKPAPGQPDCQYIQHLVNFYAEFGVVKRWLTLVLDAQLARINRLENQGRTQGLGDWTFGVWTGLVVKPVRLAFAATVGIPLGDRRPTAGPGADPSAEATARSLPTGDGEWDVDLRLSLGYSFGGKTLWPLRHYIIAEAGYWVRSGRYINNRLESTRFNDAFVYRGEFGVQLPWFFLDRFWFAAKVNGVESFATGTSASQGATGLGQGVTYAVVGAQGAFRIWKGLGVYGGFERPVRGRSIAIGNFARFGIYYQR
jgi:hypothetical protein